jgi:hypothetical protein
MNVVTHVRRAAAITIGLGAVLAVSAATAAKPETEFGKLKTARASVTVPGVQLEIGSATAKCPKGSRAVSGGWTSDPINADLQVFESRRVGKRKWKVAATQPTNNAVDTELTALAYCDELAPRAKAVEATATVPAFGSEGVEAKCPKGAKATAGGMFAEIDFVDGEFGIVLASHRTGKRTWRTHAGSEGGTPQVTAIAYCTRGVGKVRVKEGSDVIPDPFEFATAETGKCKKKVKARAGGFEIEAPEGDREYLVGESRRAGRRWVVSAHELSAENAPLNAFAYCP